MAERKQMEAEVASDTEDICEVLLAKGDMPMLFSALAAAAEGGGGVGSTSIGSVLSFISSP